MQDLEIVEINILNINSYKVDKSFMIKHLKNIKFYFKPILKTSKNINI